MFVRNGAVTPGPSRECDITFFVKGRPKFAQQLRDSTVAVRRAQSVTVHPGCHANVVPRIKVPPLKMPDSFTKNTEKELKNIRNSVIVAY